MSGRTFAIGDIHGDLAALATLFERLPTLGPDDTVVFLGDYIDRGPNSAGVVAWVRDFVQRAPAKVVCLRGNHEDAWLQVLDEGWPEFVMPRGNGCLECYRSFKGLPAPGDSEIPTYEEYEEMFDGRFFPADVVEWMKTLPFFYEDEHAIYVHAGIKREGNEFPHPSTIEPKRALLWLRDRDFFENYRGKLVVFGHTTTRTLPNELSTYTPEDPTDLCAGTGTGLVCDGGNRGNRYGVSLPGTGRGRPARGWGAPHGVSLRAA